MHALPPNIAPLLPQQITFWPEPPVRRWRPSNHTVGMSFITEWCGSCQHQALCEIPHLTMMFDVEHEFYPNEWRYNHDNEPVCSKHQPAI